MAAFLPRLKANGASFGEFVEPKKIRDRTYTMPYWRSSDLADDFVEMAYREGWVQKVDWVAWAATATGRRLLHEPGAVEDADLAQLRYLITALIRKDRFVDGTLVAAFESGLLSALGHYHPEGIRQDGTPSKQSIQNSNGARPSPTTRT